MKIEIPIRGKSVVSSKGQTVIPKEIRKALNLMEGTQLAWILRGDELILFAIPEDPVGASIGVLKGKGSTADLLEERRADREKEEAETEAQLRRWRSMP